MINKKELKDSLSNLESKDLPLTITVNNHRISLNPLDKIQSLKDQIAFLESQLNGKSSTQPFSSFDPRLMNHSHHRINPKG